MATSTRSLLCLFDTPSRVTIAEGGLDSSRRVVHCADHSVSIATSRFPGVIELLRVESLHSSVRTNCNIQQVETLASAAVTSSRFVDRETQNRCQCNGISCGPTTCPR